MVVLVAESGIGTVGANSYCTVAFADEYFSTHPFSYDVWLDIPEPTKASLLIYSSAHIDSLAVWAGYPVFAQQSLRWPRYGATDLDGRPLSQNSIPLQLKQAVCELAVYLSQPQNNVEKLPETDGISELRIDVIQLKFTSSSRALPVPVAVSRLLRGLGVLQTGSRVRKVRVEV